MIGSSDILQLPYTPDLSESGSAYACRWLAGTSGRLGSSPYEQLRIVAGQAAVELAFRRHLNEQAIPFEVLDSAPFTHPAHYEVALGGHRCILTSQLITRRRQVTQIAENPGSLLQAQARLPLGVFTAEGHHPQDLYLFAFIPALRTNGQADIKKAMAAGQPVHLLHALPEEWRRPANWLPLQPLALKSDCATSLRVEIGGLDAQRDFLAATIELPPHTRIPVPQDFYSLAYVHAGRLPEARLGLHSPKQGQPYIIQPHAWGNIRLQAGQILLAGWLTQAEFRKQGSIIPFGQTRGKNLVVPVNELHPIAALIQVPGA